MKGYHQLVCIVAVIVVFYDVTVDVLEAYFKAGVAVGVGSCCVHEDVFCAAGGADGAGTAVLAGICEGTGVVPVDAGVRGAGVEERVWAGDGVGSVVLRHRSLSVSLGALATGARRSSCCDC